MIENSAERLILDRQNPSIEKSDLLTMFLENSEITPSFSRVMVMNSETGNTFEFNFESAEIGDNEFIVFPAFLYDELSRCILRGDKCVILCRNFEDDNPDSRIFVNGWVVLEKNFLIGLDSEQLIESYSFDSRTDLPIDLEPNKFYSSSRSVEFFN